VVAPWAISAPSAIASKEEESTRSAVPMLTMLQISTAECRKYEDIGRAPGSQAWPRRAPRRAAGGNGARAMAADGGAATQARKAGSRARLSGAGSGRRGRVALGRGLVGGAFAAQQAQRLGFGQRFDAFQIAQHGARAHLGLA